MIVENLQLRAEILRSIRTFFLNHGFLEVDTPLRIPVPAPEANIDPQCSEDWFLHTSPELCMKRLLAAGVSRLVQICRCFRKNERGAKHLPEFTMLEWYAAGCDYHDMMAQTEGLIRSVASDRGNANHLVYGNESVELTGPWPRMSVSAAFDAHASVTMEDALVADRFNEIMALEIEPDLGWGTPVFLYDYPVSEGASARLKPHDHSLVERFELYICGIELCNGFSELTDPKEQRLRFEKEQAQRRLSGKPVYPMPEKFLQALADMPAAGGNALGIDRLAMLFADTPRIDDVVAFPPEVL